MKIKIIEHFEPVGLQDEINDFCKDIEIVSVGVTASPMHDLYENRPPQVCNQWTQYIATIIYK